MAELKLKDTSLSEDAVESKAVLTADEKRERFMKKKRKVVTHTIDIGGEPTDIVIVGLGDKVLNKLQEEHPVRKNNTKDRVLGQNSETFPPALFTLSVSDPDLTEDEWSEIWNNNEEWSAGELGHLFDLVLGVSTRGFDVSFTESG